MACFTTEVYGFYKGNPLHCPGNTPIFVFMKPLAGEIKKLLFLCQLAHATNVPVTHSQLYWYVVT